MNASSATFLFEKLPPNLFFQQKVASLIRVLAAQIGGLHTQFVLPKTSNDLIFRKPIWINVTTNPTAEWVARQITEAFPWDGAPGYMIRDRDRIYGAIVTRRLRAMGIRDKPIVPASPWQNGFDERLIGSIRRECLDHIIVLGEEHLRRILKS